MATMATKPAANPIHWGRGQGAGRAGGAGGTAAVAHDIEIAAQLVGVGIAAGWILAQGVGHDGGELAGDLYRRPIQITRFALVEDFGGGNRDGRAAEGMLTGEHLVEDDAEREDVGASVGRLAAEHFGGHVDGRAGHDAPFGESLGGCRGPGGIGAGKAAGDSEVEQLDLAGSGEHDVFRLDIAVENAFGMRGAQSVDALEGDGEEAIEGHRGAKLFAQGGAGDKLHDEQDVVLLFDHVVDGGDVGVTEGRGALAFAEEEAAILGGILVAREHALDSDGALQRGIEGAINLTHAAGTEERLDSESADLGG